MVILEQQPQTSKPQRPTLFSQQYYERIMREYCYFPTGKDYGVEPINFSLGNLTPEDLGIKWLCHTQGDLFSERFSAGTPSLVTTGIGLSGPPHVGTLSQIIRAITLQKAGVPVQFVLGDLDAFNGKNISLSTVRKLAERYRRFVIALGFNTDFPNILRNQYDEDALPVLRTAYLLAHYLDDSQLESIEEDLHPLYAAKGKVDGKMTFRRECSLCLMLADFIHPAIEGTNNIMVTLGIDEHRYVLPLIKALDFLKIDELVPMDTSIATLYSPIIRGLFGYPKMSKSFPDSGIFAGMDKETITNLLLAGDQNERDPYLNPVFQTALAVMPLTYPEVEELAQYCTENGHKWERYKRELACYLYSLLSLWS